jgi:hypothetical protein
MELVWQVLLGLVRLALAGVCGWLVSQGIIRSDQVNDIYYGVAVAFATVGWTLWTKYRDRLTLLVALAHPKGTTLEQIQSAIKRGARVDVATPPSESPVLTQKGN